MNKFVLAGIGVALVAAGGAAAWMFLSQPEPEPVRLEPSDYTQAPSWDTKPEEQPAAVWEDGWAIDVVQLTADARRAPEDYAQALDTIGPVYAPKLRPADFAEDVGRALEEYIGTHNNGRAFVIASNLPLPASAVPVINADPMVRARFGGMLMLDDQEMAFATDVNPASVCSDRFGAGEVCAAPLEIRRTDGEWVIDGEGPAGGPVVDGFAEWLDNSAPKLAEPLGDLEEVEIIDIRRPGQTD